MWNPSTVCAKIFSHKEFHMQFPLWADNPKLSKKRRATLRLKYIISHLSLMVSARQSHRALGEACGLDHSTISMYVRRGGFSQNAASMIETTMGREHVRAEWLVDPLSIKTN
jgi:hypothetical protein